MNALPQWDRVDLPGLPGAVRFHLTGDAVRVATRLERLLVDEIERLRRERDVVGSPGDPA